MRASGWGITSNVEKWTGQYAMILYASPNFNSIMDFNPIHGRRWTGIRMLRDVAGSQYSLTAVTRGRWIGAMLGLHLCQRGVLRPMQFMRDENSRHSATHRAANGDVMDLRVSVDPGVRRANRRFPAWVLSLAEFCAA